MDNDIDKWAAAGSALLKQDTAQQVRNNLVNTSGKSADQAAEYQHLAAFVQVPVEAVHQDPDSIKAQAAVRQVDADALTTNTPALAKYLTDPNNAAKSHDDIAPLAGVERAAKTLPGAPAPNYGGQMLVALPDRVPTLRDRLVDWWAGITGGPTAEQQRQAAGDAEANAILAARARNPALRPAADATPAQIDALNNQAWESSRQAIGGISQFPQMAAERFINTATLGIASPTVPTKSHSWQASTAGAAGGLAGFIAGPAKIAAPIVGAIPGAGALAPVAGEAWLTGLGKTMLQQAATLGLASGLQETGSAVLDSHSVGEGAARVGHAASSGAAVGATFGAAGKLLPDNTIAQWLGRAIGVSAVQDALDGTNPMDDRPLEDKLFGYGMNALFTMQGAGRTSGGWFIDHPDVRKGFEDVSKAEAAQQGIATLQGLGELAAASKTRGRDPEAFKQFVRDATDDGQLREVYVDANKFAEVLNQSGVTLPELQRTMPEVAAQLAEAAQTKGEVRIPVEDYATHIAGGKVDAALLPHLKVEPEGMTYAESQAHIEGQQAEMQQLATKILADKQADDAAQTDAQGVHDKVLEQLDGAARFRPEVNKAYATLARDFYATMAERAGTTPAELYERYPHKVTSEALTGLDQGNRGSFDPESSTISLLKDADLSTYLHESGHFFLETLHDMARTDGAPEGLRGDFDTLLKSFGVAGDGAEQRLADWSGRTLDEKRAGHEQFARSFEAYLMEGKAPSLELQGLFSRFRSWLVSIYKSLAGLNVQLSDEVRAVMDRLLASDEAIRQAEQARSYAPMPPPEDKTPAPAEGMTRLYHGGEPMPDHDGPLHFSTQKDYAEGYARKSQARVWYVDVPTEEYRRLAGADDEYGVLPSANVELPGELAKQRKPLDTSVADQFAVYKALGKEATDQAMTDLSTRSMRDMRWASNAKSKALKDLQKQADAARQVIREEVTKEVMESPVRQAEAYLKREGGTDPAPAAEMKEWEARREEQRTALADIVKAELLASPEGATVKGLKKGQFLAKNKRVMAHEVEGRMLAWEQANPRPARVEPNIDVVADIFGFASGKALRKEIAAAGSLKDQISALTDQRMLERHGELVDAGSMERAAEAAIHNDARARFMATGLKILTNTPIPASQIAKGAQEAAAAAIAAKRVGDLRPAQHAAAEARANREVIQLAPKDPAGAASAQRAALLNNRLFKAATDAVAEVQKGVTYLKKFDKDSVRGKLALDIREQIDDLLDRFDLRKYPDDGPTRKQVNLQQWIESQVAAGYAPNVAAGMLDPRVREHFKDMTVEQFRGLVDTVKAMEYIGRQRRELTVAGERVDLDDYVANKLVPKLQERGERFSKADLVERPEDRTNNAFALTLDRFNAWRRGVAAQLKPIEFKRNEYDVHELLGPMGEAIFEPVLNANYHKVDMLKGLSDDFQKLADDQGREWQDSLREMVDNRTLMDPDLSESGRPAQMRITRAKMIGIAIHVGNESNFDKLVKGWDWQPDAIWSFLHEHMTEKDWKATQGIWDLYEKHWPDMEAMNRRLGNTAPEKIEPRPFMTKFGEQRGGYAAIAYDPLRSRRGEKEAQIKSMDPSEGLFGRSYFKADTTTNGSLNGRIDGYTDRVELNFHHIAARLHETIHDLAYRETAIDVNKILEHPDFRAAFRTAYGPEAYKSLQDWLGKVVNSENMDRQVGALGRFLQYTRTGMVMTAIALRASTVLKHGGSAGIKTTGYFLGGGEKYLAARFASMSTDYKAQIASAKEKFPEIRARLLQQDRDFRVTSGALFERDPVMAKAERFGHAAVAWSDMMTAVPTAWAAYDRAITEGIPVNQGGTGKPMTEEQAVNYANKIVREAHGSNIETARSMVMNNSSEAIKMFTTLYGFMNNTYGQALDGVDKMGTPGLNKPVVLARSFMALIVPAIWAHTLVHGLPGDDDGWAVWIGKAVAGEAAGMVPFVRDCAAMVEGYSHAGVVGAESWLSTIVKAVMDAKHLAEGKEVKAPIKDIANAAGMGLHIPGLGQLGASAQYATDVAQGKEHPADKLEYAQGIALGHGSKHH
jgi:hypothetical protein